MHGSCDGMTGRAWVTLTGATCRVQTDGLGAGVVRGLKGRSGFSAVEIFRKYLWYVLRERKFDEDAVADLALLRNALSMTDDEARPPSIGSTFASLRPSPSKEQDGHVVDHQARAAGLLHVQRGRGTWVEALLLER